MKLSLVRLFLNDNMAMKPVILRPRIKQASSLIFLHGLGDTGHGWAGILNKIRPDHLKVSIPRHSTFIYLNVSLYKSASLSVSECVCLFPNSSETANPSAHRKIVSIK